MNYFLAEKNNLKYGIYEDPYLSLINNIPEKGLILDAGAGEGKIAGKLSDSNRTVICLDIVKPKNIEGECQYVLGTIDNLPFKDGIFDSVYSLSVLQLVKDNQKCLKEFHRIIKDNGTVFLTIPTKYSIFHFLRELEIICSVYQSPEFNVPHHHYYSRQDLNRLSEPFFSIILIKGYSFNFFPRFIYFIQNIVKTYGGIEKNKFNPTQVGSIKEKKLLFFNNKKIKRVFNVTGIFLGQYFPDFAYHFIVLMKKKDPR